MGNWLNLPTPFYPQFGDVLLFDSSNDNDVVGLVKHVLSNGIEVLTHSDFSHCAMVLDGSTITESTIRSGVSGPQNNPLNVRVEEEDGPSVWWLPMRPEIRGTLNFDAMRAVIASKVGKDRYSVRAIGDFLLRPILPFVKAFRTPHPGEEVCSEYVAQILQAGGIAGPNPHQCSPGTIAKLGIWQTPVQIWKGE